MEITKYDFSFTASSLRINEMVLVAKAHHAGVEVDYVNDLGGGKSSTGKRMLIEINKRLSFLKDDQLELLVNGDLELKKQIGFLSICKAHGFIRDFVLEVLREKLLMYDYQITDGDYVSFFRRKYEEHEEMEKLTDVTLYKIRQVTFKILEQSGLIDTIKHKMIQPQFIDGQLLKVLINDNPNWLKIFLITDSDIKTLAEK